MPINGQYTRSRIYMTNMSSKDVKDQLITLLEDYRDFNSSPITIQPLPTAVDFAKQVSKGYPCIYQAYTKTKHSDRNVRIDVDPNLQVYAAFSWTKQDLVNLVDEEIEVAVTPNGRADDVHHVDNLEEPVFLAPATIDMTISELLEKLNLTSICSPHHTKQSPPPISSSSSSSSSSSPYPSPIYYLQSQNSNLTTTPLRRLLKHVPTTLPFADPVLSNPEATNIWIGDSHSTTSTHRDPYENLYLVLKGTKIFTLYPPVDEITLPTQLVRTGKYIYDPGTKTFSTLLDEAVTDDDPPRIPWITVDPLQPHEQLTAQHEMYALASPRTVTVEEGQVLYLPSGWYHHVQQRCGVWEEDGNVAPCIAVNYWYDMEYEGEKYVMRQLVGRLKGLSEGVGE